MWKIQKLDLQLFEGFAARVHEFLDIEPLMPPGRLRVSKLLGRPITKSLHCKCLDCEMLDDLEGIDCTVAGEYGDRLYMAQDNEGAQRLRTWSGHVSSAPRDLVGVMIISDEDLEFGRNWYAKYGQAWPLVSGWDPEVGTDEEVHPALEYLDELYHQNSRRDDWASSLMQRRHAAGLDGIWYTSRVWTSCICGLDAHEFIGADSVDPEL